MTAVKCKLCFREPVFQSDLCRYHDIAQRNLLSRYERWRDAYEDISWKDYLEQVKRLNEVGIWVKEVAELELEKCRRRG